MHIIPTRFNQDHIETRVDWINNPLINQSMFFDLPATVANTEKWFRSNLGNSKRVDFTFLNGEAEILAMGGFTGICPTHKNAEFYVMVNPSMHGQGVGKHVSIWMYNYAFSVLNLNKIFLYTNDDNIAAYRIYENAGFVLEGVLRQHKFKNGNFRNRRFYGLLYSEWEKMSWKEDVSDEI